MANEVMVTTYNPSPCNECHRNNRGCSTTCAQWEAWFKPVWRALRKRYGYSGRSSKRG